jgi:hypothetical protein
MPSAKAAPEGVPTSDGEGNKVGKNNKIFKE